MSTVALAFAFGLPLAGAGIAWAAALRSWRSVRDEVRALRLGPREASSPQGRFMVLFVLPSTLPLYGFAISFLLLGRSTVLSDDLQAAVALTYGATGFLTGVGHGIILWRGTAVSALRKEQFGRVVVLMAMIEVAVLFAFALAFLVFTTALDHVGDQVELVPKADSATQLMAIGGLGAPLAAFMAMSAYDLQTAGSWKKGILRGAVGLALPATFFVLAYITITAGV